MIHGTEMVQTWLHQLDPQLNLDECGFCALTLDGYPFGLQLTAGDDAFFLEIDMKTVSANDQAIFYKALQANNFQEESRGGFFAIDTQRHALMYQSRFNLAGLDFDAFVAGIHTFVANVAELEQETDTWESAENVNPSESQPYPEYSPTGPDRDQLSAAMPVAEATLGFNMLPLALFV